MKNEEFGLDERDSSFFIVEAPETTGTEQDKDNHNLCIADTAGLVKQSDILVFNHIFFLLLCELLAKFISHTINPCNFRL